MQRDVAALDRRIDAFVAQRRAAPPAPPARPRTLTELADDASSFAPLRPGPWDADIPAPTPYRPTPAHAPWQYVPLHMLAAFGGGDDAFMPLPPDGFDQPRQLPAEDESFAPLPPDLAGAER